LSDLSLTSFGVPDLVVDVVGDDADLTVLAPRGPAGEDGNTILSGADTPSDTLGSDGDFYLDLSSYFLYGPKANGAWSSSGAGLIGPAGAAGADGLDGRTILDGIGAPSNATGTDGDYVHRHPGSVKRCQHAHSQK
jgi:hypothetical protein